jgi:hypothetical protein
VSHERQSFKALLQLIWLALLLNNSTVMLQQLLEKRKQIKAALDAIAQRYLAETGAKSILADVRTVKEHIIAPQEKY